MDLIICHGSPGNGKTTLCKELHEVLKSPWFEFGWIPEFASLNPCTQISFKDEEQMSFENLVLVTKNYIKHGFENVMLSDLNDIRMLDIPVYFKDNNYVIITLYSESNDIIKERILSRQNGNTFTNFEQSFAVNEMIVKRKLLPNEYRIRSDNKTVKEISTIVLDIIKNHQHNPNFSINDYCTDDYFTYFNENGGYCV